MYREDYAQAGFVMLPAVDPDGFRTGRNKNPLDHDLLCCSFASMPVKGIQLRHENCHEPSRTRPFPPSGR